MGPTLFSIHYYDIVKSCKNGDASLFADDTEIHTAHSEVEVAAQLLNSNLKDINDWLSNNEMVVHPVKSEAMKIGTKQALKKAGGTEIKLNDHKLKEVSYCKYLGVFVDSSLDWPPYIDHICKRTYPKLRLLNRLSCFLCSDVLIKIYKATILPILDYACIVWMDCPKNLSNKLERLQNQALRIIFCKNRRTCSQVLRDQVKILTLFNRRRLF